MRYHVARANDADDCPHSDAVVAHELGVEPRGVFDARAAQDDRFDLDARFQISVLAGRPMDVHHLCFRHLVGKHHLEGKGVCRVSAGARIDPVVAAHDAVDFVRVIGAPFLEHLRKVLVGKGVRVDRRRCVLGAHRVHCGKQRHLLGWFQRGLDDLVTNKVDVRKLVRFHLLLVHCAGDEIPRVGELVCVFALECGLGDDELAAQDDSLGGRQLEIRNQMRHVLTDNPVAPRV